MIIAMETRLLVTAALAGDPALASLAVADLHPKRLPSTSRPASQQGRSVAAPIRRNRHSVVRPSLM